MLNAISYNIYSNGDRSLPSFAPHRDWVQRFLLLHPFSHRNLQKRLWNGQGNPVLKIDRSPEQMEATSEGLLLQTRPSMGQTSHRTKCTGKRRFLWKQEYSTTEDDLQSLQKIFWEGKPKSSLHRQPRKRKNGNNDPIQFWKTITYSPPIYGADLTGSLMD